jgi:hypothetical protein
MGGGQPRTLQVEILHDHAQRYPGDKWLPKYCCYESYARSGSGMFGGQGIAPFIFRNDVLLLDGKRELHSLAGTPELNTRYRGN